MNNEQIFHTWTLYGMLVQFGVFSNVWRDQVAGGMSWVM